jgi:hypothetical protein
MNDDWSILTFLLENPFNLNDIGRQNAYLYIFHIYVSVKLVNIL